MNLYQAALADAIIQGTQVNKTRSSADFLAGKWELYDHQRASVHIPEGQEIRGGGACIHLAKNTETDNLVLIHGLNVMFKRDPSFTYSGIIADLIEKHGLDDMVGRTFWRKYSFRNNRANGPFFALEGQPLHSPVDSPLGVFYAQVIDQIIGPLFGGEGSGS